MKNHREIEEESTGKQAFTASLKQHPLSVIVIFLTVVTLILLLMLVCYHGKLVASNLTTNETMRSLYNRYRVKPFDSGSIFKNCLLRIWVKKPAEPIFKPQEIYYPDASYKGP
jgi:hypothetical protein